MKKSVAKLIKQYCKHTGKSEKLLKKAWKTIPWDHRERMKAKLRRYNDKAIFTLRDRKEKNEERSSS